MTCSGGDTSSSKHPVWSWASPLPQQALGHTSEGVGVRGSGPARRGRCRAGAASERVPRGRKGCALRFLHPSAVTQGARQLEGSGRKNITSCLAGEALPPQLPACV